MRNRENKSESIKIRLTKTESVSICKVAESIQIPVHT